MNSIGPFSFSSAYASMANSVYGLTQVSAVNDKQEASVAENLPAKSSSNGEIKDEAIVSDEAKALLEKDKSDSSENVSGEGMKDKVGVTKELTPEQEQVVAKLKLRDAEVRTHEQAHISAASGVSVSAPSFSYQTGPDGKQYAVGGEVSISFSSSSDPAETISKAQAMKSAALAPAEPSSQDMAVAQNAEKMIQEARKEMTEQKSEEIPAEDKSEEAETTGTTKATDNSADKSDNSGELTKSDKAATETNIKTGNQPVNEESTEPDDLLQLV